jgi:thymidylate synthase (FAD)
MKNLEELKWKKFSVLNDGFVTLVDVMGDDAAVAQAARVCYGAGTKSISDDRALIRYLMRHNHTSPFEQCEVKLLVRTPMDVWRQWIRHRTANVNEYSTRYSIAIDERNTTNPDGWRLQAQDRKQGSGETTGEFLGGFLSERERELHALSQQVYNERIVAGIAREQARKDLPLSTYTEAYWKMDLHNLLHFLYLRMDNHAQLEIRQYASIIGNEIVAKLFPLTWEAFVDFMKEPVVLNRLDTEVVQHLMQINTFPIRKNDLSPEGDYFNLLPKDWQKKHSSERDECVDKLQKLGMIV